MRCRLSAVLGAHILVAAVFCHGQPKPAAAPKEVRMTPSQVVESVKSLAWARVTQPGAVAPTAGPALLPLLDDPNPQVRELTVYCLDAAGGAAARQGLIKALNDRIETVNTAAARALANHYTAAEIPTIRNQMSNHRNEVVRENLALLLGKTGS